MKPAGHFFHVIAPNSMCIYIYTYIHIFIYIYIYISLSLYIYIKYESLQNLRFKHTCLTLGIFFWCRMVSSALDELGQCLEGQVYMPNCNQWAYLQRDPGGEVAGGCGKVDLFEMT